MRIGLPPSPSNEHQRKRFFSDLARAQAGMPREDGRGFMLKALRAAYKLGKLDAGERPTLGGDPDAPWLDIPGGF